MRRLYVGHYSNRASYHIAHSCNKKLLCLFSHRLSRAMLALIRMVDKTLKASPLSNRRFERSEYPRYNPNRNVHLEEVPQQPVTNSKMSGHPFRMHISTHEYPECTDLYSGQSTLNFMVSKYRSALAESTLTSQQIQIKLQRLFEF